MTTISSVLSTLSQATLIATNKRIGHREYPDVLGTFCVYEGFTVGFTTPSGTTSFLCLPLSEENIDYYSTNTLFGNFSVKPVKVAEYNTFIPNKNSSDAACALCQVFGRDTILVLPATDRCIPLWIK